MSDSVRPHRRQPTRLPCPWDSPGRNTGVGCHFLLQCMKVKSESEVTQWCPTLSDPISDPMDCSLPGASVHGIFQARDWCGAPLPSPNGSAGYINPNFPVHPKPLPHPHVHMSVPYICISIPATSC